MGKKKPFRSATGDSHEPFPIPAVEENVGSHPPSPSASSSDSWDEDVRRRIAEFFSTLDRWERRAQVSSRKKEAA